LYSSLIPSSSQLWSIFARPIKEITLLYFFQSTKHLTSWRILYSGM
jgi:hypothetical protein